MMIWLSRPDHRQYEHFFSVLYNIEISESLTMVTEPIPTPSSECQNVKISIYRNTEFHQNPLTKNDRCIKTKEGNSRFIEDVVVGCRWVVTSGCCNYDLVAPTRSGYVVRALYQDLWSGKTTFLYTFGCVSSEMSIQ